MRTKKGFTLVELIAVVVILSIILILIIPNFSNVSSNSKESLRDSKIRTIVASAEDFGNDTINKYRLCVGSNDIESLERDCTVEVNKLVSLGYLEGEDDANNVIDPVSNEAFNGKVLLCYNPVNVNVYAYYVDDRNFSCKDIDLDDDHTLNLSSVAGNGYIGGEDIEVNIITSGTFEKFVCNSDKEKYANCSIEGNKLIIKIANSYTSDISFPDTKSYEEVNFILDGHFTNEEGEKTLVKRYSLRVYPTSISINNNQNQCLLAGTTENVGIVGKNLGPISISSSDKNILDGIEKNGTLFLSAQNNAGEAKLTLTEGNGKQTASITRTVYSLNVDAMPDNIILDKKVEIPVSYNGTGNLKITSSDSQIIGLSTQNGTLSDSITLKEEESFFITGIKTGEASISIQGQDCGSYEHNIKVSNLALSETEGLIYLGGNKLEVAIDVDDTTGLTCESSNANAASCEIHATTLEIYPGTEPAENVEVSVNGIGDATASIDVDVLKTEVNISSISGYQIDNVCTVKGSGRNSEDPIIVTGLNIGDTEVYNILDWYLADATIETRGNDTIVSVASRDVTPAGAIEPYVAGPNTGRTKIEIRESNGNQIGSFYYNIYTMDMDADSETLVIGDSASYEVIVSGTGEISAASSNSRVAKVEILEHEAYDETANAQNTRIIKVTGNDVGKATITITGQYCGSKTFEVRVTGRALSINLEPGTYTDSLESNKLTCITTGFLRSCEAILPEIYASGEFEAVGYSTEKDSTDVSYRPGDTITINSRNEDSTYYGNSSDVRKPTCSIATSLETLIVGETSYFTLTCVDMGSGINGNGNLRVRNFSSGNSDIGEVVEVSSPVPIENGYTYQVGVKSKAAGYFDIELQSNAIEDNFGNGNDAIGLQDLLSYEYEVVTSWYIGKTDTEDVMAVLYDNADVKGTDDGTYSLMLYGSGDMIDFMSDEYNDYAPWYESYNSLITDLVVNEGITNIGKGLMYNMTNLSKVTIGKSVVSIGENAFANCNLEEVIIPDSVETIKEQAFYNNSNLKSISLGNNLKDIEPNAFFGHQTTSISIPSSVQSIGNYAFAVDNTKTILSDLTFENYSNVVVIGEGAFINHIIETLDIPPSVQTIGNEAFKQHSTSETSTLSSVNFASNGDLSAIGDYAFAYTSLNSLSLPNSLETIGEQAFGGIRGTVTNVTIGPNVSSIGNRFIYGKDLKKFIIDLSNEHYTVLDGVLYTKDMTTLVKCPDDYYIDHSILDVPETVTTIQSGAFAGWLNYGSDITGLTINLPSGITNMNIDDNFVLFSINAINISENSNFESIDGVLFNKDKTTIYRLPSAFNNDTYIIPSSVTNIANYFGYGNSRVKEITVPESVTSIGSYAFAADSNYGFNIINLYTDESVIFDETSLTMMTYSEESNLEDQFRTINVTSDALKEEIEQLYAGAMYTIVVNTVTMEDVESGE